LELKITKLLGYGGNVYVIIVYDVAEKRVNKVCQFLRRYLNWIQNSVFEGELTISEIEKIKLELRKIINLEEDSIIFYLFRSEKAMKKFVMGVSKADMGQII